MVIRQISLKSFSWSYFLRSRLSASHQKKQLQLRKTVAKTLQRKNVEKIPGQKAFGKIFGTSISFYEDMYNIP